MTIELEDCNKRKSVDRTLRVAVAVADWGIVAVAVHCKGLGDTGEMAVGRTAWEMGCY